ncbi:hypothetical protein ACC848_43635, partial [Rhizobium johnstonii]
RVVSVLCVTSSGIITIGTPDPKTTRVRVAAIQALGTPLSDAVVGWINYFERFDVAKYGSDGGPLHDPNVIAYLLKPELYS